MIRVLPVSPRLDRYIRRRGLQQKFVKQSALFSINLRHPGLRVERLEPKEAGIYSFRLDRKYRVLFSFVPDVEAIQILDITDHYQ